MRRSAYKAPSLHPNAHDTRKTRSATTAKLSSSPASSSSSSLLSSSSPVVAAGAGGSPLVDSFRATRTTSTTKASGKNEMEAEEDVMRLPDSSSSDSDNDSDENNAPAEPVHHMEPPVSSLSLSSSSFSSKKRKLAHPQLPELPPLPPPPPPTRQKQRRKSKLQDTKADLPVAASTTSHATDDNNDPWDMLLQPSLSSSQRESQKLKRVYSSSMRKKEAEEKEEFKTFKPDIKMVGGGEQGDDETDPDQERIRKGLEIKKPPPLEEYSTAAHSQQPQQPQLVRLGKRQTREEDGQEETEEGKGEKRKGKEAQPQFKTYSAALESFSPVSSKISSSTTTTTDIKGPPPTGGLLLLNRKTLSISSDSSLSSPPSSSDEEQGSKSKSPSRQKKTHDKTAAAAAEEEEVVCCPLCRKVISPAFLQQQDVIIRNKKNLNSLSLKYQRDFCYKHRLAEAREASTDRGYPANAIDWAEVKHVRIPQLLTHLRQVLQRETPSFYLEQLDDRVAAAKTKPKVLHSYLHSGVLDVVKPGYYGPKGQKVVCDAVTNALVTDLKQASRHDKALRLTGIGAYVAAVLVPECTMKLVMEDTKTRSQDLARDVLAESSDIGQLLNPDDDHVEILDGE